MTEDNRPKMHRIKKDPQELDPRESPNPQRDNPTRWERFKQEAAYAGRAAGTFVKDNWPLIAAFAGGMVVKTLLEDSEDASVDIKGILYKSPVNVTQIVERRGHPGYVIKCNETGEQFASIRRAADLLRLNRGDISKHLNGLVPDVKGLTFTLVGEAQ